MGIREKPLRKALLEEIQDELILAKLEVIRELLQHPSVQNAEQITEVMNLQQHDQINRFRLLELWNRVPGFEVQLIALLYLSRA